MLIPRGVKLGLVVLATGAASLSAQRWHVEATGTRITFDTLATVNSASLAPHLTWQTRRAFGNLGGSVTAFGDGRWGVQGQADLSLLLDPFGRLSAARLELAGALGGTYHSSGFRTAATRGDVRFHLGGRHIGIWAGPTAATGWTSGGTEFATGLGATGGVWARLGRSRGAVSFAPLWIEGYWLPELRGQASAVAGPVEITGYGGWRGAEAGSQIERTTWGGGTLALWFSGRVALIVAAGSYPRDLFQGLPGGRYLSAGLRVASRRPTVVSVRPLRRPVYQPEDGSGVLRFEVRHASRVELVADWTNWQPVAMQRDAEGKWALRVRLHPGVYRFNLIVDGERWIVPEGVLSVDDGYGGRTGLLVVP